MNTILACRDQPGTHDVRRGVLCMTQAALREQQKEVRAAWGATWQKRLWRGADGVFGSNSREMWPVFRLGRTPPEARRVLATLPWLLARAHWQLCFFNPCGGQLILQRDGAYGYDEMKWRRRILRFCVH